MNCVKFSILIVSALKICKQCLQTASPPASVPEALCTIAPSQMKIPGAAVGNIIQVSMLVEHGRGEANLLEMGSVLE